MEAAISQTLARRSMQSAHNVEHGIVPQTIRKALPVMGEEVEDLLSGVAGKGKRGGRRMVGKAPGKRGLEGLTQKFGLGAGVWNSSDSVLENVSQPDWVSAAYEAVANDDNGDTAKLIVRLEKEMRQAAARLDFERAAQLRDRIFGPHFRFGQLQDARRHLCFGRRIQLQLPFRRAFEQWPPLSPSLHL